MASKVIRMTFFFSEAKVGDIAKRMKMKTKMKNLNLWKFGNLGSPGFTSISHGLLCKYPPEESGPYNGFPLTDRGYHNFLRSQQKGTFQVAHTGEILLDDVVRDNQRSPDP
jgi:hypothetical protein